MNAGKVESVVLAAGDVLLNGDLAISPMAGRLVLFADGSDSSRRSARNRHVAFRLRERGCATLLLDLLSEDEKAIDRATGKLRFDIALLASRLRHATDWAWENEGTRGLQIGYFGTSTGAAAALVAAAGRPDRVKAVVARGGRSDLASGSLDRVRQPTLFIVGSRDTEVLALNREAAARMVAPCEIRIVEGAGPLFEEPGALDEVAGLGASWFEQHLPRVSAAP